MVVYGFSEKVVDTTSNRTGKDITKEIEVDKEQINIYSINDLAPSSAPITIPYMEVYRTNELEYVPYISPYNVGVQSDDSSNESESDEVSLSEIDDSEANTNSNNNDNSTNV